VRSRVWRRFWWGRLTAFWANVSPFPIDAGSALLPA
jgi:hypothetical protein